MLNRMFLRNISIELAKVAALMWFKAALVYWNYCIVIMLANINYLRLLKFSSFCFFATV